MTTGKRLAVGIGIGLLTALRIAVGRPRAIRRARPYPQQARGVYRSGLAFGGSLGAGSMASDGCGPYCGGAGMIEGHIGAMLNPRLALMGDFFAAVRTWDDGYFTGTDLQRHLHHRCAVLGHRHHLAQGGRRARASAVRLRRLAGAG